MRFLVITATLLAFGTSARAEVNVRIASVADAGEKAACIDLVKRSLRALDVPSSAAPPGRAVMIDVVVKKRDVLASGEVTAVIEIVLSNSGGIRSIASGKASFVARKNQLRNQGALRQEALRYALEALHRKVRTASKPVS